MGKEYTRNIQILGNIPNFGKIVLFDNFSNNLSWDVNGNAGYIVRRNPSIYLTPPASLQLSTPNGEEDNVTASKYLYPLLSNSLKVSIPFLINNASLVNNIKFSLLFYTGVRVYTAKILWLSSGTLFKYANSDGAHIALPDGVVNIKDDTWNRLEFSINTHLLKYSSFSFNNIFTDLSSMGLPSTPSNISPSITFRIELTNNAEEVLSLYLDAVLISED